MFFPKSSGLNAVGCVTFQLITNVTNNAILPRTSPVCPSCLETCFRVTKLQGLASNEEVKALVIRNPVVPRARAARSLHNYSSVIARLLTRSNAIESDRKRSKAIERVSLGSAQIAVHVVRFARIRIETKKIVPFPSE